MLSFHNFHNLIKKCMNKQRIFIYSGFILSLFTLLGIAFFYLNKLNTLSDYRNRIDHSYRIILQIGKLKENLLNAETGQRGYLITRDSSFLQPFIHSYKHTDKIFYKLDSLTRTSKEQQKHLDTLKALIQVSNTLLLNNLSHHKSASEFSTGLSKSKYYMDKIKLSMEKLKEDEVLLLNDHDLKRKNSYESSRITSYAILCLAFLLCFIGAIVIINFFNKILKYQKKLSANIYQLESLNQEIIRLSYASSHNLQEPTRKIQIIIDKLEHEGDFSMPTVEENLVKIKRIFAQQQQTNKHIIDYYAILNRPIEKTPVSLTPFVTDLIAHENLEHQATFQIRKLPTINADKEQIKRLLANLIENCITFNQQQKDLTIEISEIPFTRIIKNQLPNILDGFHVICIADNGVGVPPELHEKIFELFQKIPDHTSIVSKTGMGLSFSKRIMLNHHGWIEAHNNSPKGLKIYLYFPIEAN